MYKINKVSTFSLSTLSTGEGITVMSSSNSEANKTDPQRLGQFVEKIGQVKIDLILFIKIK